MARTTKVSERLEHYAVLH